MYRTHLPVLLKFLKDERLGGYLLFSAVFLSMLLANSAVAPAWHHLFELTFGPVAQGPVVLHLHQPLHFWINDLLMAVFFLLAGLEIKRELRYGELRDLRKASLPVFAAIGGMVIPVCIFLFFTRNTPDHRAWGIPMATDIAFSLAILALCGKKIPLSLKIFLTTLALVDDLGAILVIALFYTTSLSAIYLVAMAAIILLLLVLNYLNIRPLIFYLIPGLLLWYFTYRAGIHATISGVLLALCVPDSRADTSPLRQLEHLLGKPVAFIIMPVFALANTAIGFKGLHLSGLADPVSLGIMLGLLLGKPIGIVGACLLAIRLKLAARPVSMTLRQLAGLGLLGGIGFSMSIFISLICYPTGEQQNLNCLAILLASVLAGTLGYSLLNRKHIVP